MGNISAPKSYANIDIKHLGAIFNLGLGLDILGIKIERVGCVKIGNIGPDPC